VSTVALWTAVVLLAASVALGQDLAVPNGEGGGGLAASGGGGGGRARTAPTRVQQVTLYPATEPGGRMQVNPPFLEMIEKEPGERPVDSDLKAVNRKLCQIAGGSHDENYDCRNRHQNPLPSPPTTIAVFHQPVRTCEVGMGGIRDPERLMPSSLATSAVRGEQ